MQKETLIVHTTMAYDKMEEKSQEFLTMSQPSIFNDGATF